MNETDKTLRQFILQKCIINSNAFVKFADVAKATGIEPGELEASLRRIGFINNRRTRLVRGFLIPYQSVEKFMKEHAVHDMKEWHNSYVIWCLKNDEQCCDLETFITHYPDD